MDITLRPVTEADSRFPARDRGRVREHRRRRRVRPGTRLEVERSLGGVRRRTIVATAAAFSFELTVPGHTLVPTAGVTMVGVHPTHRAPRAARADDGGAARRRRARGPSRSPCSPRASGDLRAIRLRPRHVLDLLVARGRKARPSPGRAPPAGSSDSSIRRRALAVVPPLYDAARKRTSARSTAAPSGSGARSARRRRTQDATLHRGARVRRRPRRRRSPGTGSRTTGRAGSPPTRSRCSTCTRSTPRAKPRSGGTSSTSTSSRPCGASAGRWTNRCGGGSPIPAGSQVDQVTDHLWVRVVDPAGRARRPHVLLRRPPRHRAHRRVPPANEGRWSIAGAGDGAEVRRTDAERRSRAVGTASSARSTSAACRRRRWPRGRDRIAEMVPGVRSSGPTASSRLPPRAVRAARDCSRRSLDASTAALSCMIASMGPGSTSLSSAR